VKLRTHGFECFEAFKAIAVLLKKLNVAVRIADGLYTIDIQFGVGDVVFAVTGLFFHF
jgi:hypothetical protein